MKITRVITGFVAVIALISISFSGACSVFPEKKIIYTANKPEGFYQVTVTETEGWYNWFCAEKSTATFQARVVNKNEVALYYDGERHSWLEKAGKGEIRWHHTVGVGSFLGVPWRYEKRIDTLPRDHPLFDMFEATTKHWQSKRSSPFVRIVVTLALAAGLFVAIAIVVAIVVFLKRKVPASAAAEPPPETLLEEPIEPLREEPPEPPPPPRVEPPFEGRRAAPPPGPERPRRRLTPAGCILMIVIAAVVAVAALVAVFLVADYLGYNPLTAPPAEEQPAAPPTELEPQPIVPETKIELSAFRILGGGRTPASIRRDLAGKAKSLAGLFEGHGAGELLVDLAVSRSGAVARAKVLKSTYNKPAIESKVAYALRGWKFGPARGATTLKVKISVK